MSTSATASYSPHGAALLDCFRGDDEAVLNVHQNGSRDDVPASFWLRRTIDPLESAGLGRCHGRVLDVGAGAGVHALELRRRGRAVTAIDVAPECVQVMRERGVPDAAVADLFAFDAGTFDTVLGLCNGLDKVGTLAAIPRFLDRVRALLAPGGSLVADSFDGVGEPALQFEHRGRRGPPFTALHVDFPVLERSAHAAGWACEEIARDGRHDVACARPRGAP